MEKTSGVVSSDASDKEKNTNTDSLRQINLEILWYSIGSLEGLTYAVESELGVKMN